MRLCHYVMFVMYGVTAPAAAHALNISITY